MKLSLVLEDVGAGPQVILSTGSPEEARQFYKRHNGVGRIYLVINPTEECFKHNKQLKVESVKPVPRKLKEALI